MMAEAATEHGIDFSAVERTYRQMGSDDMTILLEFEAWAGAAVLSDAEVEEIVEKACLAPRPRTIPAGALRRGR